MERLTRLKMINRMLLGIRLAPVATVDDLEYYHEGAIASSILEQVTLEILSPGWNFNTRDLLLEPDALDSTILVPSGTLEVMLPTGVSSEYQVVVDPEDNKLINLLDGSKEFTEAFTARVILGYPTERLPVAFQMWILHQARLSFKLEMKSKAGADAQVVLRDISKAESTAKAWDLRQKRRSVLDTIEFQRHINPNVPRW